MVTREDVFRFTKETYGTEPDYLWQKHPRYAILRHKNNNKWYGLVMNLHPEKVGLTGDAEIDVLNLKCPNELLGSLRQREGIRPAYHMNKEHWVSVVLADFDSMAEVAALIAMSYELTE